MNTFSGYQEGEGVTGEMSHPCDVGAPMLSQVSVRGLWSGCCFGHLSAGALENPFHLAVFIQRTRVTAFSRLRGNLSSCAWVKAIATVNGLSQQQCLQTSFLFLCRWAGPVADPWAHRKTPLRACLYFTSRLQLSFIFCGLFQTVWGPVPHWYLRTAKQHDCLIFVQIW